MARTLRSRLRDLWTGKAVLALPGIAATLVLLALHVAEVPVLRQLGNLLFDTYQRAAPRPYEPAPVKVVDIDDETLQRLGQWPWPRTDVARLTKLLTDAGAAAIAFDIVFSESDRTSPSRVAKMLAASPDARGDYADVARMADHDALFGQALGTAPSIPGFFMTRDANPARPEQKAGVAVLGSPIDAALPAFAGAIVPLPVLAKSAAGAGFVSIVGDSDGIIRRAPLLARVGDQIVPSLSLEALRVAQQAGALVIRGTDGSGEMGGGEAGVVKIKVGDFEIPTTPAGELWMNYTEPRPDRIVPAWKILTGAYSPAQLQALFAGNIVFIGTGAAGLRDLVATPVRERELGVIVHAQAVEQMILGRFVVRPDWAPGVERLLLVVFGLTLSLALPRLGATRGGVLFFLMVGGVFAASWYAYRDQQLLIDPTVPALAVLSAYMFVTAFTFYREESARRYIHQAFDRYLSPELVERIARDPGQLQLGGEERDMTVMFCDVRSFSRISESLGPQEIIKFLIEFLTPMTDILLAKKATIDKYIGDAVLAFWNAPLDDPDHATNAARGALAMVDELARLNALDPRPPGSLWPGGVKIGIGLNTGRCCVGNMGSAQRLSYSIIGDTVNLASRIEGLTKYYGVAVAVGAELASRLDGFALLELDAVRVVGRDAPERIYALLGTPEAPPPGFAALRERHAAMLAAYRAQDWDAAQAVLDEAVLAAAGLEKLQGIYAERIAAYRVAPPGADWDGVYQATEK
ncbi:CHASE2 domain-containing protein [Glacieibacterium frigidum]|uniref:Adenylate/guanylate cyclase domain-containing protein n=1 Tax=Glacieibacterium frigidum TaxID=2593303 RepID=A0A552U9F8_9SPHN|nr:adenylate/guanylate cyclase domain-containing protein [Glacieibacterium frigidum]TRW14850.1 adenylate/guanylate cyclase domain-containing protein [Glacieibacterium frigidum]